MSSKTCQLQLPYAGLNLRCNPFGELSVDDWTALAVVDVDSIVALLGNPEAAVQFVGEKGYGKTTHLLSLRGRLPNSGYVHIPEGQKAELPTGNPVMVDEAQRLTFWQRRRLFPSSVALVLGTHRDFHAELRRAGRYVKTIAVERGTTPERLRKLVDARIQWARRDDDDVPVVTEATITSLLHKYGPNIRGALHELYSLFQNLDGIRDV